MIKDPLIIRCSDGTLWEPSTKDGYGLGDCLRELFSKKPSWFFRQVNRKVIPRFFRRDKIVYERTGNTWEPTDPKEFTVIEKEDNNGILPEETRRD